MDKPASAENNNLVFIVGDSKTRDGCEEDVKKLYQTFEQNHNSEIHNWMDRTKIEYKILFSDLNKYPVWLATFKKCKFVALFSFLFHGDSDGRLCFNNSVISLKCFFLNPLFHIKELAGKLKWLIAQACRGSLKAQDFQADGEANLLYLDYYMISYCTGECMLSYQVGRGGKIFILYLCDQLKENAQASYGRSLVSIMKTVNEKILQYGLEENFNNFPTPEYLHNFDGDFTFSL